MRPLHVLLVGNPETDITPIIQRLQQGGYIPTYQYVWNAITMQSAMACQTWDVIVALHPIPGFSIFDALHVLNNQNETTSKNGEVPFIVVSSVPGEETAVAAIKAGAHEYLVQTNLDRLVAAIEYEMEEASKRQAVRQTAHAPHLNETHYREISEMAADFAYALRLDANNNAAMEWMTESLSHITGYSQEELKNGCVGRLIHPDDQALVERSYQRLLDGTEQVYEFRIISREGASHWLHVHSRPVWDATEGRVVRLYGVGEDITIRKHAEEALRRSEGQFSTFFHANPLPILISRRSDGCLLDVNQSFLDMAEVAREDVIGRTSLDVGLWRTPEERVQTLQPLQWQNSLRGIELTYHARDGTTREIQAWIEVIELEEEPCLLSILHDITERKQAEATLKRERDFHTAILDTAGALVMVLDPEGQVARINRASEQLSGYNLEEFQQGVLWDCILPPEERAHVQSLFQELANGKFPKQYEGDWITKTGQRRRIAWSNSVILNSQGAVEYVIGTGLDVTERRQAEQRIHRHLQNLSALRRIQTVISTSLELYPTLEMLIDHVTNLLEIDAADVLLLDSNTQVLTYTVGRGFHSPSSMEWSRMRMGEGYAGRAAIQRRPVKIADMKSSKQVCVRDRLLKKEHFVSYYGMPLITRGQVKGVLELFHRSTLTVDQEWLNFIESLAGHAAVVIENSELVDNLKRSQDELMKAYDATIEGWARALELRDAETEGHSRRVVGLTLQIARAMGIPEEDMVNIRRGTILHDIGKMGIPDSILLKPGKLTPRERKLMEQHPVHAYNMLYPIVFLRPALDIPYCHHEKWNGTGYPRGLKETEIPLSARIFAVVDVWDALCSDRPYRKGWPKEKVLHYIQDNAGTHFDPNVVEVFLRMMGGSE